MRSHFVNAGILLVISFIFGCQHHGQPRLHVSQYFGGPMGVNFEDPAKLGNHSYSYKFGEKNGMIYTCKGGFIDMGHLREAADRTRYAVRVVRKNMIDGNQEFSFKIIEPSRYRVKIGFPAGWEGKSEMQKLEAINTASLELGQYIAHRSLIWHEILTWYGFSSVGLFSEKISSFSPEDSYSDALGTNLAVKALRDGDERFDENMTTLISGTLQELGAVGLKDSKAAAANIKGDWYSGGMYFFAKVRKNNFDVGIDDGFVTPFLVDGVCDGSSSQICSVPTLGGYLSKGFTAKILVEPRVMEKGKIWRELGLEKNICCVDAQVHFEQLLGKIKFDNINESALEGGLVKR